MRRENQPTKISFKKIITECIEVLKVMSVNEKWKNQMMWEILLAETFTYVQKCMQWRKWRNWRKIASRWRFELDAKSGPLVAGDFGENGDFGEIGDFGKNRHACNGETGEKSPASGDLNWMPKVAPWWLAILAKMAILAKLAILAKIAMHAMAKLAKNHQPLAI